MIKICIIIALYISHAVAYMCIHDDYVLEHDDHILYTVSQQLYSKSKSSSLLNGQPSSLTNSLSEYSATEYPTENNTQPIRFLLDLTYLDEDPGLSCFHVGQMVRVNSENYTCAEKDILTAEREEYIRRMLVPAARDTMQSLFKVMPVDGALFLQGGRCGFQGGVPIPESYTRAGVGLYEVDLVVFVTARPVLTPHVLAFAGQCQEDQIGRAIAGHLNINPSEVDVSPYAHEGQLGIVMHELTHVMGFSFGKFANFHVPPPKSKVGYTYVNSGALAHDQTESIVVVNSPKVLEWVRDYYGCDSLPGAPLENGGGSGTKLSHWEKRTFMNEYMTGEATHNPVMSALTLALFEDSGWYLVNYSHAKHLMWGKGRGCDFVQKPCDEWPSEGGYYCKDTDTSMCTFDLKAKGECNMKTFSEALPLGNQYFSSSKKGGRDTLADYCPYISPSTTWCNDETNMDLPTLVDSGETYCPDCGCLSSSLVKEFPFGGSKRLGCYRMECASQRDLRVMVGKLWYECPANASITVEGFGGHIFCPTLPQIIAVCANNTGETFASWPSIFSISPAIGSPGSKVTITGTGFSSNVASVVIHKECSNFTVVSDSVIVATLPDYDKLGNPAHIVSERVNVIVRDKEGRNGLAAGIFTIRVSDDPKFYIYAVVWILEHWLTFVAVFGAVGSAYFVRAARRRELQLHLQRSTSYVQSPLMDYEN